MIFTIFLTILINYILGMDYLIELLSGTELALWSRCRPDKVHASSTSLIVHRIADSHLYGEALGMFFQRGTARYGTSINTQTERSSSDIMVQELTEYSQHYCEGWIATG